MAFLIIMPTMKTSSWEKRILASEPGVDLRVWPATGAREEVAFVLAWRPPPWRTSPISQPEVHRFDGGRRG
jgi:hypothetical protein